VSSRSVRRRKSEAVNFHKNANRRMFGSPSQSGAGELLFSGNGGGGAGGLFHGRSGSSGDAPQAGPPGPIGGLGAGTSSFDLSNDFPTLGGGAGGPGLGGVGTIGVGGSSGLAGTLRQQQLLQQQQQQQQYRIATAGQGSINIATEDFPALGSPVQQPQRTSGEIGAAAAVSTSNGGGNNPILNGLAGGIASLNVHDNSASSGGNPKSSSLGGGVGVGGPEGAPGTAINSEYGLLGLLSIIRISEDDRNALALGEDLSMMGLNLNSDDRALDTFGGPFTDKMATSGFRYNVSTK